MKRWVSVLLTMMVTCSARLTPTEREPWRTWKPGQIPLSIIIDEGSKEWTPEIREAAAWWNEQLGREVFLPIGMLTLSGGIVSVAPHDKPDGMVGWTMGKTGSSCGVVLLNGFAGNRLRAAKHELGHVLGLSHDYYDVKSVMWPQVESGEYGATKEDIALLRSWLP